MRRTFNMGIGLIVATAREHAGPLVDALAAGGGQGSCVIGEVVAGPSPAVTYV